MSVDFEKITSVDIVKLKELDILVTRYIIADLGSIDLNDVDVKTLMNSLGMSTGFDCEGMNRASLCNWFNKVIRMIKEKEISPTSIFSRWYNVRHYNYIWGIVIIDLFDDYREQGGFLGAREKNYYATPSNTDFDLEFDNFLDSKN